MIAWSQRWVFRTYVLSGSADSFKLIQWHVKLHKNEWREWVYNDVHSVKKLHRILRFETWIWSRNGKSQTAHTQLQRPPYATASEVTHQNKTTTSKLLWGEAADSQSLLEYYQHHQGRPLADCFRSGLALRLPVLPVWLFWGQICNFWLFSTPLALFYFWNKNEIWLLLALLAN